MIENVLDLKCQPNEVALNLSLLAYNESYLLATRYDVIDLFHVGVKMEASVRQFWGENIIKVVPVVPIDNRFLAAGAPLELYNGQDARLFRAGCLIWMAFCREWRQWLVSVDMNHQGGKFGPEMVPCFKQNQYVLGPSEKNWTWIDGTQDTLDCIYRWEPFTALRFHPNGSCLESYRNSSLNLPWQYGRINGGTPSVLLPSGERFSVFHSHLNEPRTYYMGGIYHQPGWPYEPIRILRQPLLVGTGRFIRWPLMKTLQRVKAVFPCGLVAEPDRLLVSYGLDDCACAIASFTYDELASFTYDEPRITT